MSGFYDIYFIKMCGDGKWVIVHVTKESETQLATFYDTNTEAEEAAKDLNKAVANGWI
jgi:hypothetical protein